MLLTAAADDQMLDPNALLSVLALVQGGDFSARMPLDWTGIAGKVADALNDVIISNQVRELESARVAETLATQLCDVQRIADELRVLTHVAPIGIFQTDANNRYVYTNPGWSEITGVSAQDALGTKLSSVISADDRDALLTGLARDEFCDRFQIVRPDLAPRTVVLTWRAIPHAQSDRSGSVGTLADVTAEAKVEATMTAARDAALAATIMQKNFTASASHELKTPTAAILGFCEEILENDAMTAEDLSFLEIVYRNAQRLNRLTEDLLIVGQDGIDAMLMHLEPTDVIAVIDRVIDNFRPAAQQADVTLTAEPHTTVAMAIADPLRLEQALNNLVSNAMKFTPEGGQVTISVDSNPVDVNIRIIDDGIGISLTDTARIFDRFYRAQAALDASVTGSGLGLSITKDMIEAQNGTITVTSEVGRGSAFLISLPTADEQKRAIAVSAPPDNVEFTVQAAVGEARP